MASMTQPRWPPGADLHFHLLPGVDDGPATMEESLELGRAALSDGSGTLVATPHVRPDFPTDVRELVERVRELQAVLDAHGLPLLVRRGGELGHDMVGRLDQRELEAIAQGPPGARWLLVEAPFEGIGYDFHAATGELRDRGFGVVVAHPERSADASLDGSAGLRRELARGSLAQVNALSLTGSHGVEAEWAALELIDEGLVAVVGSDAHGVARPPAMSAARRRLTDRFHGGLARELALVRPRQLLAHGLPAPAPTAGMRRRRGARAVLSVPLLGARVVELASTAQSRGADGGA